VADEPLADLASPVQYDWQRPLNNDLPRPN